MTAQEKVDQILADHPELTFDAIRILREIIARRETEHERTPD